MKLVELLAKELDVWPEGVVNLVQNLTNGVEGYDDDCGSFSPITDCWDGRGYTGVRMDNLQLATDHATAIVTREMWEAERDGGWIAWGGGECPLEKGTIVDVRFRSGEVAGECGAGTRESAHQNLFAHDWEHSDSKYDIVAYRLHKPAQQEQEEMTPCEELGYKIGDYFVMTDSSAFQEGDILKLEWDDETSCPRFIRESDGQKWYECLSFVRKITKPCATPYTHRDTIIHCQAIIEDCERDISLHTEALASEGFELINLAPVEDMSDWRNWKVGDLIDVKGDDCASDGRFAVHSFDDDEDVTMNVRLAKCGWPENTSMKWHSRP